jgi:LacI family transcriptional regulator
MARARSRLITRPTIRDVAAQAGVSVSSVSRALNGAPYIRPELHARIMRAVDRLGFEPQSAAQALRSRATNTIGCMVADISNPLYTDMITAAEDEFRRAGYVMMLGTTRHEEERETAFLSAVRRRRMDGLLLFAGDNGHEDFASALATLDLPCVGIDRDAPGLPSVRADHRGGSFEVTRYLIGLGHRRIALLTGRAALLPTSERLDGYRRAHFEAGFEVDQDLVRPQLHSTSIAFSDVCQLLQGRSPPTAIITLGTHMLASVLDALASNDLRYPEDVSVVCVGDTDLARYATPAVTSLTWDLSEMGRTGARMLLDRIGEANAPPDTRPVYLPTRFILRHSCAAPAGDVGAGHRLR